MEVHPYFIIADDNVTLSRISDFSMRYQTFWIIARSIHIISC